MYDLMFSIELSMKKRRTIFCLLDFCFLYAINVFLFRMKREKKHAPHAPSQGKVGNIIAL